jgi:hypothetical protein
VLLPIAIPPGIVKNGTPYGRRGRWEDCNLVRWHNDAIRSIGGWLLRTTANGSNIQPLFADPAAEAARDVIVWRALNGNSHIGIGSNLALYHVSQEGVVTNVTPAGINKTPKDANAASGYGIGPYSFGAYGVFTPVDGVPIVPPQRWVFDTYGEILLAAQRGFGPIYEMNPTTLAVKAIAGAPTAVQDLIVTEQRIVLTIGGNGDPRLVKWSDQENRSLWAPAVDNQAGDFVVQGQGKLLTAISVLQQVLIVGERDAAVARYIGPPYVFSFDLAGRNCGSISAEAVAGTDRFAVWWGDKKFWLFDGSLSQLPCTVQDFLDRDVNGFQISKVTAVTNQLFSEVWWFYQSNDANELDSYVMWCYKDNTWWTGKLARTGGADSGVLANPVWISVDGRIYNHELDGVAVDGDPFIESAMLDMQNGERNMAARYIYPDTEAFGDALVTIKGRQFSTSPEFSYGPYPYNNPTPVRAQGRALRLRFDGQAARFEVGTMRLELSPLGGGVR